MPLASSNPHGSRDARDAFFAELHALAQVDPRVMVLTDDQSAFFLDKIGTDFSDRYINVGIAEQNLLSVAAGLALGGLRPFVCGISNFLSLRVCEQVSVNLSAMNLPVTIVASGGGLTYASDGPTHHATLDVAVMRAMPNLTILNPSDAAVTEASVRLCSTLAGPAYVRIEKGMLPRLYEPTQDFLTGMAHPRRGEDVLLVSTGYMVQQAVRIADWLAGSGVNAGVLDLFRLKPLNKVELLRSLGASRRIAVIEEQTPVGGIGSIVCEVLGEAGVARPVRRFSLPDAPCYRYGSREWLHHQFGIDPDTLGGEIAGWVRDSGTSSPPSRAHARFQAPETVEV
jgi:transketolase